MRAASSFTKDSNFEVLPRALVRLHTVHEHGLSAACALSLARQPTQPCRCLSARQRHGPHHRLPPFALPCSRVRRGSTAREYPTRSCPACCKSKPHSYIQRLHVRRGTGVGGFRALRAASISNTIRSTYRTSIAMPGYHPRRSASLAQHERPTNQDNFMGGRSQRVAGRALASPRSRRRMGGLLVASDLGFLRGCFYIRVSCGGSRVVPYRVSRCVDCTGTFLLLRCLRGGRGRVE